MENENQVNANLPSDTPKPEMTVHWSTGTFPRQWATAWRDEKGNWMFRIDKEIARLMPVSETEDELILRLEPKQ